MAAILLNVPPSEAPKPRLNSYQEILTQIAFTHQGMPKHAQPPGARRPAALAAGVLKGGVALCRGGGVLIEL